jgi:hypothetical protein
MFDPKVPSLVVSAYALLSSSSAFLSGLFHVSIAMMYFTIMRIASSMPETSSSGLNVEYLSLAKVCQLQTALEKRRYFRHI